MNILTFDIEEWFHILDNKSTKTVNEWINYETRIYRNMDKIFKILDDNNLKATFFIVGWIAKKYPKIIKKIDENGYQIGSHTYLHQLMYEQSPSEIDFDIKKSISVLEDLTGKKVTSFRAPGFSITEKNKWVFEILAENGISHDCSIFPASRAHGGFSSYGAAKPSLIKINGKFIKEFPVNANSILGKSFIFSGGGYFRFFPYYFIKKWTRKTEYIMSYFHPRDFDPNQPVIRELPLYRKFKSYVGLKNCYSKLENWIQDFNFIDLRTADNCIDWDNAPIIRL